MLTTQTQAGATLENDLVAIRFDAQGSILSIEDRRLGCEYLSESLGANLFRLMVPSPQWDGRHIDSRDQPAAEFESLNEGALRILYPELILQGQTLPIRVQVDVRLQDERVALSIGVHNASDCFISDVIFPIVSGFGRDTEDFNLYLPFQWGGDRLMNSPLKKLGDGNHVHWNHENNRLFARYPLTLVTAWIDYSDAQGGLGFDVRNEAKDIFDFGVEHLILKDTADAAKNRRALWMAFAFYPSLDKNASWTSCEFILRPHAGDWHTVADDHRVWLEEHTRIAQTPQNFRESLGWHFFHMKHQDGTVKKTYEDLPAMAQAAQAAGIDNIMAFGWQQRGHDNDYPFGYVPNEDWGGVEKLREKLAEVRQLGCRVIPFFNGTLLDQATPEFKEFGHRWAVRGRTGSWYDGYDYSRCNFDIPFGLTARGTTSRNMHLCDLCVTASGAREWELETVRRITEDYGFSSLQLDQLAHKSYVCYDDSHGHEKPQFAFTRELESLLTEMRARMRAADPESVMIGEGYSDLTAQYCDAHWNWWQTVFPEIIRYSVPWMLFSHETDALEYKDVNICFVNKILLDLKIEGGDGCASDYPAFCAHLKQLAALKRQLRDTYLDGTFRDEEGIRYDRATGLLAKVYVNPARKRVGLVAANLTDAAIKSSIQIEFRIEGAITTRFLDGREANRRVQDQKLDLALDPYEVRAFEMSI